MQLYVEQVRGSTSYIIRISPDKLALHFLRKALSFCCWIISGAVASTRCFRRLPHAEEEELKILSHTALNTFQNSRKAENATVR
jgi:hypothetical protein